MLRNDKDDHFETILALSSNVWSISKSQGTIRRTWGREKDRERDGGWVEKGGRGEVGMIINSLRAEKRTMRLRISAIL